MTIQEYPLAGTEETSPLERVADYAYWQLLLGPDNPQEAASLIVALSARLWAQLAEIWTVDALDEAMAKIRPVGFHTDQGAAAWDDPDPTDG